MLRLPNVATPPDVPAVRVPDSVAAGLPVPDTISIEMLALPPVTTLPNPSSTATRTAGAIDWPAAAPVGSVTKPRREAAALVTSNGALVAESRPGPRAVSVYALPARVRRTEPNEATPPCALAP